MRKNKQNIIFRDNIQKSHINNNIYLKNKKYTDLTLNTIYKNLDTLFVEPRDLILKGQPFAKVRDIDGNGSHLYFEIWKDNQVVDPRNLIVDYKEKDVSIR